jgi:hypothetical protein
VLVAADEAADVPAVEAPPVDVELPSPVDELAAVDEPSARVVNSSPPDSIVLSAVPGPQPHAATSTARVTRTSGCERAGTGLGSIIEDMRASARSAFGA